MSVFRDKRGYPTGEGIGVSPSSVNHIAELAAAAADRNHEALVPTGTEQARSIVRKASIPEAAAVFSAAMKASRSTRDDVAAALDLSPTIVTRWAHGRASIPSDCVWGVLRRHPDLGEEILIRCADRLDLPRLRRFAGRILSRIAEREREEMR